jgi:hypothetical protein
MKHSIADKTEFILNAKQVFTISFLILAVYFFIFGKFFPNANGNLGHDYSQFLPQLLDGVFWFKANGLFAVPWFTPSFGGGLPNLPNPQSMYYSVPQFLSFFLNPVTSVKLTLLLFGGIGFYGCFLILKRIFLTSSMTAILGATLFLFNGFYTYRMIIGHLTFHAYMLFPLFIYTALQQPKNLDKIGIMKLAADIGIGSIIIGYMIYSGAYHIIPPLLLTVIICSVIYKLMNNTFQYFYFIIKLLLIFIFGFGLAADKLNASIHFLDLFPSDLYPLPGIPDFVDLLKLLLLSLLGIPDVEFANKITVNKIFYLEQHEYEFGIGIVPFIIILLGFVNFIYKIITDKYLNHISLKRWIIGILLFLFLLIPLLLNYFTPWWNAFIKTLPFIKNTSTNIRWFSVYIPVFIFLTCIVLEKVSYLHRYKFPIALTGILLVLLTNFISDKTFYQNQTYSPKIILLAYDKLIAGTLKPEITSIATKAIVNNDFILEGNDLLVLGASQLNPYEPIFGYRLENFPRQSLTLGSVMQENEGGVLNMKNPSCYVFPEENHCLPGGHFTIYQKEIAEKFRNYLAFTFYTPYSQEVANFITLLTACSFCIYLMLYAFTHPHG